MKSQNMFDKVDYNENGIDIEKCIEISDHFAIGFAEFVIKEKQKHSFKMYVSTQDYLEVYKRDVYESKS
jgi:hypothetical protein